LILKDHKPEETELKRICEYDHYYSWYTKISNAHGKGQYNLAESIHAGQWRKGKKTWEEEESLGEHATVEHYLSVWSEYSYRAITLHAHAIYSQSCCSMSLSLSTLIPSGDISSNVALASVVEMPRPSTKWLYWLLHS